ncbi:MAG: GNAT family N-acetyltransferase [Chloroflexota bacterium]
MTPLGPQEITNLSGFPSLNGLQIRHLDLARDVGPLAALIADVNVHDNDDLIPTEASLRNDFEHTAGMSPTEDIVLAEVDGSLIGAAQVSWRVRTDRVFHSVELWVRPEFRRRGLGRALLAWAESRVMTGLSSGTMGPPNMPHVLSCWAGVEIGGTRELATRAGYHINGYGIVMIRPLAEPMSETPLPDGIEVRPVRPEDHRAIWDADEEAFQDHRDPTVRTEEDFAHWFADPDIDTSLWVVAWDGDEVAGSVMNFVYANENARLGVSRGWLEHISVRRPWRRRGLAAALIARSLLRLRDLGLAEAALGADAENLTGAVQLYESVGFTRLKTGANYRKAIVVPAPEATGS